MSTIKEHTLRISASTDELEHIRNFVSEHARSFGFDETDINDIQLAVDEACTNIIKHAYQGDKDKEIHLGIGMRGDEMLVSITDEGRPFDPNRYSVPSPKNQLEQKKRSGYGILLIRKLMDKVEYRKQNSRNEIRMIKKR